jgi:threonine dehydratase
MDGSIPTFDDVRAAAARLRGRVHRTPVLRSSTFDSLCGSRVWFKCENLQRGGAFKARGAFNAVFSLSDEQARGGVVTHSSGNHGAAVALAARERGIRADIVVPRGTPSIKVAAIERYGATLHVCEPTLADREARAAALLQERGGTLVHPFDDPRVIAGQGTAALELLEEAGPVDALLAPVSGGGLLSGTALAAAGFGGPIQVFGAEPSAADDAARSLSAGRLISEGNGFTIADGLRATLSVRTFTLLQRHVAGIATVSEAEIIAAMRLAWEVLKLVIEPSCAVPLAVLLSGREPRLRGRRVGVIISGGNVDLDRLPWAPAG